MAAKALQKTAKTTLNCYIAKATGLGQSRTQHCSATCCRNKSTMDGSASSTAPDKTQSTAGPIAPPSASLTWSCPRLVLDSAVYKANPLSKIPEHVSLPRALDVQRSFLHEDVYGDFLCTALDFKAAQKCVKVAPQEQGTLLFEVEAQLYHYTVCHFGARFSAYWWARVGGLLP